MSDKIQSESDRLATATEADIGVGALLRASRMRLGEDLRDVAAMLRVRYPYLEAIEKGRYEELPGRTYAVGFIRAYAEYLGLDSEEVVRRFKKDGAIGKAETELHFPTPVLETSIPSGAIISVGIVVAVIAYGGWYLSTMENGFVSGLIEPIPQRFGELVSSEKSEPKAAVEPTTAPPAPATESAAKPAPAVETPVVTEAQPEPSPAPESSPLVPSADTVAPATDAAAEPTLKADVAAEPTVKTDAATEPTVKAAAANTESVNADTVDSRLPATAVEGAAPPPKTVAEPAAVEAAVVAPDERPDHAAAAAAPPSAPLRDSRITVETLPDATPVSKVVETPPTGEQAAISLDAPAPSLEPQLPADHAIPAPNTPPEPAAPANPRQITVRAKADSWIEIHDDFGRSTLAARILKAGEVYVVPDRPGLRLITGNAGALEILIDGKAVPPIGEDGAVRRGVMLDADMLLGGTAVAE